MGEIGPTGALRTSNSVARTVVPTPTTVAPTAISAPQTRVFVAPSTNCAVLFAPEGCCIGAAGFIAGVAGRYSIGIVSAKSSVRDIFFQARGLIVDALMFSIQAFANALPSVTAPVPIQESIFPPPIGTKSAPISRPSS